MEVKLNNKFLKTCQYINYSVFKSFTNYFNIQKTKENGFKLQQEKYKN